MNGCNRHNSCSLSFQQLSSFYMISGILNIFFSFVRTKSFKIIKYKFFCMFSPFDARGSGIRSGIGFPTSKAALQTFACLLLMCRLFRLRPEPQLELIAGLMNFHVLLQLILADFLLENRAANFWMKYAVVLIQMDFCFQCLMACFASECLVSCAENFLESLKICYRCSIAEIEFILVRCCWASALALRFFSSSKPPIWNK